MFFIELFASVIFAVVISSMSVYLLRRSGYRMAFFGLFLLVLLAIWAGGIWIKPVGPDIGGVYILPFIIAGILVVVVMLAFTRQKGPYGRKETIEFLEKVKDQEDIQKITNISLNLFFYFLLVLLIVAIVVNYAGKSGF